MRHFLLISIEHEDPAAALALLCETTGDLVWQSREGVHGVALRGDRDLDPVGYPHRVERGQLQNIFDRLFDRVMRCRTAMSVQSPPARSLSVAVGGRPGLWESADLSGGLPAWMLEPRTPPRTVNDGETDACWICGDPADHAGLPHSEATGDDLTRYDIMDHLASYQPSATEPCSDCAGQGGI